MRSSQSPSLRWGFLVLVAIALAGSYLIPLRRRSSALPAISQVNGFHLTNQIGRRISLEDLAGCVWVADIIFTRCAGPCATMTQRMKALQSALPPDSQVKLISLTADPAFDTPQVLKSYAARFGASQENWHFLTGDKQAVYRLALDDLKLAVAETGTAERKAGDDLFIHSTRFALVDRQGRVRSLAYDGTDPETPAQLAKAIRVLLQER